MLIDSPYADAKLLFAHASLLHSEDSQPVAMIEKGGAILNPLHGCLISFCHRINRYTIEDPNVLEAVGVFVFPDLSVRHDGLYRLCFHVYEVEEGEIILRGIAISNTFRVYAAKEFPGMADSTQFTELLKNHGLRVRVAKTLRAKRRTLHNTNPAAKESSREQGDQYVRDHFEDTEYHGAYDMDQSTRDSTPELEDPQEFMVDRSYLIC